MSARPPASTESVDSIGEEVKLLQLVDRANDLKIRSEMGHECVLEVAEVIKSTEQLVKERAARNVVTPTAMYLDMKILHSSTMALSRCLQSITSDLGAFDPELFADSLAEFVKAVDESGCEIQNWSLVEDIAVDSFKTAPCLNYLMGNMEEKRRPERSQRQRSQRQRMSNEPFRNARGVEQLTKEEVDMEERMRHISGALVKCYLDNGRKPVDYLSFVLDPDSFSKTVENIFHVSHLIREGMFRFFPGDDEYRPALAPMKREKRAEEGSRTHQELWHFSFNMNIRAWEEMKRVLQIKKAWI